MAPAPPSRGKPLAGVSFPSTHLIQAGSPLRWYTSVPPSAYIDWIFVSCAITRSRACAGDTTQRHRLDTSTSSRLTLITRSNTSEPQKARLLQDEERAARVLAQRREALHHRVVERPDAAGEALLQ